MSYSEIPSDQEVVDALKSLGSDATAVEILNKLFEAGHPRRDCQLAIQRSIERGLMKIGSDWRIKLVEQRVAA